jgi:hypothetical protein
MFGNYRHFFQSSGAIRKSGVAVKDGVLVGSEFAVTGISVDKFGGDSGLFCCWHCVLFYRRACLSTTGKDHADSSR